MQMGTDLAYMGTPFINTKEAAISVEYKNMIIEEVFRSTLQDFSKAKITPHSKEWQPTRTLSRPYFI